MARFALEAMAAPVDEHELLRRAEADFAAALAAIQAESAPAAPNAAAILPAAHRSEAGEAFDA